MATTQASDKATPAPSKAALEGSRTFSGKVVETMNAASYTYVRVDTGKEQLWAAVPQTPVKVGDTVTVASGMPMFKHHSNTLKRDFDVVYFAGGLQVNGAQPAPTDAGTQLPAGHPPLGVSPEPKLPAGHPPLGAASEPKLPAGHPSLAGATASPKIDLAGIKKAKGGQTIQEIFANQAKLKGQEVKVRGKVVKFNAGIMGKNWLHLQDGTGTPGKNDLIITTSTSANAKVGDTVLASGKLSIDKDFGFGYKFPVIVEDAKVAVE
jgi:hypothetical protein